MGFGFIVNAPSISIELLVKKKPPAKIVNLIGSKIISNVDKHYSTYDSLKYCLCSDIVMRLSFFPPNSSICNPIATYLNLIFLCFFIKNTTL